MRVLQPGLLAAQEHVPPCYLRPREPWVYLPSCCRLHCPPFCIALRLHRPADAPTCTAPRHRPLAASCCGSSSLPAASWTPPSAAWCPQQPSRLITLCLLWLPPLPCQVDASLYPALAADDVTVPLVTVTGDLSALPGIGGAGVAELLPGVPFLTPSEAQLIGAPPTAKPQPSPAPGVGFTVTEDTASASPVPVAAAVVPSPSPSPSPAQQTPAAPALQQQQQQQPKDSATEQQQPPTGGQSPLAAPPPPRTPAAPQPSAAPVDPASPVLPASPPPSTTPPSPKPADTPAQAPGEQQQPPPMCCEWLLVAAMDRGCMRVPHLPSAWLAGTAARPAPHTMRALSLRSAPFPTLAHTLPRAPLQPRQPACRPSRRWSWTFPPAPALLWSPAPRPAPHLFPSNRRHRQVGLPGALLYVCV